VKADTIRSGGKYIIAMWTAVPRTAWTTTMYPLLQLHRHRYRCHGGHGWQYHHDRRYQSLVDSHHKQQRLVNSARRGSNTGSSLYMGNGNTLYLYTGSSPAQ
jgi:hypothetical protein